MQGNVNIAIQILPQSTTMHAYDLVDEAIAVIKASGVKYQVCPFETVMEGPYDDLMEVVKQVQEKCYEGGMESALVYLKVQSSKSGDVQIDDKIGKYKS